MSFIANTVTEDLKINNKSLSSDINLSSDDVNAVPISRTINGQPLSADISLNNIPISAITNLQNSLDSKQVTGNYVKSINSSLPDENGNVQVSVSGSSIPFRMVANAINARTDGAISGPPSGPLALSLGPSQFAVFTFDPYEFYTSSLVSGATCTLRLKYGLGSDNASISILSTSDTQPLGSNTIESFSNITITDSPTGMATFILTLNNLSSSILDLVDTLYHVKIVNNSATATLNLNSLAIY